MQYISTRGDAPPIGFLDAVLAGLAPDGGLYVPETWPVLTQAEIAAFAGRPYAEVAADILGRFSGDAFSKEDLLEITSEAYAGFAHPAVTPLRQLDSGLWLLELFHGPTLAFKDVAMQLLARLYERALAAKKRTLTIVCATSGDTGGAAVEALRGRANLRLVVLFPDGRISEVQRRFMTTAKDKNVRCVAIDGTFDDCQSIVKGMFQAQGFRQAVDLSGVNSINWARIAAQVVYYFTSAVALGAPHRPVSFAVPTGNFGDAFAGYVARLMGLPIETIVAATNSNDILARAIESGRYARGTVTHTQSPAMDIQVASNFERLYFEAVQRDGVETSRAMRAFAETGAIDLPPRALSQMREVFVGAGVSEGETARAIVSTLNQSGELVDPHTAVGLAAAYRLGLGQGGAPLVVLSTAHAAKFPEAVTAAAGVAPKMPASAPGPGRQARTHRSPAGRPDRGEGLYSRIRARLITIAEPTLHRLANGVRVVCDPLPGFETLALSVVVGRGARYETEDQSGWAHLLEHMVFKGAGDRSARDIVEVIEAGGGHINAATGHDRTSFQVRALKGGLPLAMAVIADLVLRPTIDAGDLAREKHVVAQEIAEAADTPDDLVFELAQAKAFAGQPMGRPILGSIESVEAASPASLGAFRAGLYAPDAIVISAAGAVDAAELLHLAERWFGGPAEGVAPTALPAAFTGGLAPMPRTLEQAHLVLMLPAVGTRDPDYFALRLFAEILGGGMSSRLFQEVREHRGLAYAIDAFAETHDDVGVLGVYAGTSAKDAAEAAKVSAAELIGLAQGLREGELERAKAQLKGAMFMARESALARAEQSASQVLLFDRTLSAGEIAAEIDAVTAADIARLGQRLLAPGLCVGAVLGPKRSTAAAEAFHRALFG